MIMAEATQVSFSNGASTAGGGTDLILGQYARNSPNGLRLALDGVKCEGGPI